MVIPQPQPETTQPDSASGAPSQLGASHKLLSEWGGTTPIPNRLFDELMPELSDTQLRVLLVVARSTLGWQQGAGRKSFDWLSHRQLQKRTGRAGAAVSGAIDALVKAGLVVVQDGAGQTRATSAQRRAVRGQLFYRLGDLQSWSRHIGPTVQSPEGASAVGATPTSESEVKIEIPIERNPLESPPRRGVVSTSLSGLHKPKTTKEKVTKEPEARPNVIHIDLSSLKSEVIEVGAARIDELAVLSPIAAVPVIAVPATPEAASEGASREIPEDEAAKPTKPASLPTDTTPDMAGPDETERFIQRFQSAYRSARPNEAVPSIEEADRQLLRQYLESHGARTLEQWLPEFFASQFGFVRRRRWSLEAYLHSLFVLRAQRTGLAKRRLR